MSSKPLTLIFLTLTILVSFVSAANLGGWKPIDNPNDPKIVEIGKFAVAEHDKQDKAYLGFASVVRGEIQVVQGINYKLVVTAKDGGVVKTYEALVWDKPWHKFKLRQLVSFREIKA